ELGWRIVDDTLQVRGGRGYETAASLEARGELPIPIERAMRDFRINLIFEGSSEIMRLFIAREAVDHHFKTAFALVAPDSSMGERAAAAGRAAKFYPTWYAARWVGKGQIPLSYAGFGKLAKHLRFVERNTRHLGRSIFHAMVRFGPKLERRQLVLFRAVDIGAELFAMSAACVRAKMLAREGQKEAIELADYFCREARVRVEQHFRELYGANDKTMYDVAKHVLKGEHSWIERGIVGFLGGGGETRETRAVKEAPRREAAGV
ncbi:MAG: acyl-CoA dehydrogenase, partial [Gemmatimonadaceae bacterium]|nr:acyl-CoA dehydrogenase [Gemmatimonadaceae bacterium]